MAMSDKDIDAKTGLMAEHVDQNILRMLQDVMGDEYPQLLEAFLLDAQVRVNQLKHALLSSDFESLRQEAHSFKGSCSNLGTLLLTQVCAQLEQLGRSRQWQGAQVLLEQLERELAIVRICFRSEQQRYLIKKT